MAVGEVMARGIILALCLVLNSPSAFACSPPSGAMSFSNEEIYKLTDQRIKQSDAIIDGIVVRDKEGATFLKPLKVWKGPPLRLYSIDNARCGLSLTTGSKVRALLEGDSSGWMMMPPLRDRKLNTLLYDSIVDTHLRNARPSNFENGSLPYLPSP